MIAAFPKRVLLIKSALSAAGSDACPALSSLSVTKVPVLPLRLEARTVHSIYIRVNAIDAIKVSSCCGAQYGDSLLLFVYNFPICLQKRLGKLIRKEIE